MTGDNAWHRPPPFPRPNSMCKTPGCHSWRVREREREASDRRSKYQGSGFCVGNEAVVQLQGFLYRFHAYEAFRYEMVCAYMSFKIYTPTWHNWRGQPDLSQDTGRVDQGRVASSSHRWSKEDRDAKSAQRRVKGVYRSRSRSTLPVFLPPPPGGQYRNIGNFTFFLQKIQLVHEFWYFLSFLQGTNLFAKTCRYCFAIHPEFLIFVLYGIAITTSSNSAHFH